MRCPECRTPIQPDARFCAGCGGEIDRSSLPTELDERISEPSPPSAVRSAPVDPGALVAGQILAGRYRIVGLLGRGGMGEVYRADDLSLGQPVALKFLGAELAQNVQVRERFFHEVRIARQVSHPNVCRVHDIGEVDGRLYLSMEYIDGEDLASLLRRIGRLPHDKATEIAQQLCGGLASAHNQGLLHRDLKPANVMLDGRGNVKITDFGLAGFGDQVQDVRSGTPAYMAPEQLSGREVTTRSDIYSLGLVLYEVFTGKPAFRAESLADLQTQQTSAPATPSSLIDDIDPAAERVILRCLEHDPAARPESPLAVAAGLPGGDPLQVALAAGELPSPEMVAAAGEEGTLAPRVAIGLLAVVLLTLGLVVGLFRDHQLTRYVPLDRPRALLAEDARKLLDAVGEREPPLDRASGFFWQQPFIDWHQEQVQGAEAYAPDRPGWSDHILFWYRESPARLQAWGSIWGTVSWTNPPHAESGMGGVVLDAQGRLVLFRREPPQRHVPGPSATIGPEPDWSGLFEAAEIDPGSLTAVEPEWTPPAFADLRRAWAGPHPRFEETEVRVEAGGFAGQPVYFRVVGPWTAATRDEHGDPPGTGQIVASGLIIALLAISGIVAKRNYDAGRSDRKGAFRLATTVFLVYLCVWLLRGHHGLEVGLNSFVVDFLGRLMPAAGFALFIGLWIWTLYMALEPLVRKRFPERIVAWTRMLSGRLRDPLVGRDILVGMATGCLFAIFLYGALEIGRRIGDPSVAPGQMWIDNLNGTRFALARYLFNHPDSAVGALLVATLWFVLRGISRFVARVEWPATALLFALLTLQMYGQMSTGAWISWTFAAASSAVLIWVLVRRGLLSLLASMITGNLLLNQPVPPSLTVWWGTGTWLVLGLFLGVSFWAFRVSLGRQPLSVLLARD